MRLQDKIGNAKADSLAVEGAEKHIVPMGLVQAASERRSTAMAYQKALVAILKQHDIAVAEFDMCVELFGQPDDVDLGDGEGNRILPQRRRRQNALPLNRRAPPRRRLGP